VAKNVLILGFEPFGGDKLNPSELLVRSLEGRLIAGRPISIRVLPVETRSLRERMEQVLFEEDPDVILATSLYGGRSSISLERIAINVLDFEFPDNVGVMRRGDSIARGGAEARLSNLPFDRIVEAWHANGVPSYVSNAAGTFIGNQAMYELLSLTENALSPVIVGLVHLPYLPSQAIAAGAETHASMSFELMKKAIEILVETLVPWVDQRDSSDAPAPSADKRSQKLWIPRGVKEVER